MKTNENEFDNPLLNLIKDSWVTTPGKIVITAIAILGGSVFVVVGFKAAAHTIHAFKDFRDACNR